MRLVPDIARHVPEICTTHYLYYENAPELSTSVSYGTCSLCRYQHQYHKHQYHTARGWYGPVPHMHVAGSDLLLEARVDVRGAQ
eukprot:2286133-Rhodomonas_salina.1